MDPRRDEIDLAATLRALRPQPRQEFAAELDARAAMGFARGRAGIGAPSATLFERVRTASPRRLLVPAGAFALAAIVVATAIVALSTGIESESSPPSLADGGVAAKLDQHTTSETPPSDLKPFSRSLTPSAGKDSAVGAASSGPATSAGSAGTEFSPPASAAELSSKLHGPARSASTPADSGPFASRAGHRDIERSSQMVLGADASEVRNDAAKVFETVHAYDGIVLRSSISDGDAGDAGATFDLMIPSGKLGDALAAFSGIAEVRSRHEATEDITAPTVHLGEHLQDSRARIEGLLLQLSQANTDTVRAAVEVQLRAERNRAAVLRSSLADLNRRANLSHVSLRIETGEASATAADDSAWGIDDALADAGRILAIAAGVAVIGLAIVGPLALIALLLWLAHRAWVRRGRQQALR